MIKPGRGVIAICSQGYLGLITEDEPQEITYPDGNKGTAYVGIQLTDKPPFTEGFEGPTGIGAPWSSRTPKCLTHVDSLQEVLTLLTESIAIGRIRNLPEEEREEFSKWNLERSRPYLEDASPEEQDGYFIRTYNAWKALVKSKG